MKFIRYFLLIMLGVTGIATADVDYNRRTASECGSCYECSCNPLYECSWGLQVAAGVRPIVWKHRGDFFTVNCLADPVFNTIGELPKFNDLYKTPWQVGVQLSYATSCNTNLFGEFNYAQSRFKCCDFARIGLSNLVLNLTKYKIYEGYFGLRYYFDRWCDRVAFFLGGKIGALHHKRVQTGAFSGITENSIISECCNDATPLHDFCAKYTSFAGGGHLGLDICFCGNWSFVITAEVIASCACGGRRNFTLNTIDSVLLNSASDLLLAGAETELGFPITFGLKYNF